MNRLYAVLLGVSAAACGGKSFGSLCDQIPPPAACMEACDPQPGAPNTCTPGYHCSPDGHCDAQCLAGGDQCGEGYTCTADGFCQGGTGGGSDVDANCPAVHFAPMPTTPSIELVLDRSGSMDGTDIAPTRYQALHTGLTGAMGAVTQAQGEAYFGVALFAADQTPCLNLNGFTAPRALNNASVIDALIVANPPNNGNTPTADAIIKVTADFALNPPPAGSPPVILLATDGEPNSCTGVNGNQPSIDAVKAAYAAGIRTFIIGLAGLNTGYLQQIANAGVGQMMGNAPYYTANNPQSLVNGFNSIINGVLSCDLTLTGGTVDPNQASSGQVTLNGMPLQYGTDWTLDPNGMVIHILGQACTTLKNTPNAVVDAAFVCGSVIF
jgi:hypothetical protein